MLLFQKRFHDGLVSGAVRLTVRLWDTPHVKVGGRYRVHPIGVVEVDAVERVPLGTLTDADARAAGLGSLAELLEYMRPVARERGRRLTKSTAVFKVSLRHVGDGDRVSVAMSADLTAKERLELAGKLERLDRRGPWTLEVLRLIRAHPRVAASKLARSRGEETAPFKVNVRKLKRLGLTMSFEVGYELSPRGEAYLRWAARRPPARPARRG